MANYGERRRQGEAIATGFVESTVNAVVSKRFAKRQQMQWTPAGAHLLLQVRTKVLNGELDDLFREWYPGFRPAPVPHTCIFGADGEARKAPVPWRAGDGL
jgi:hypothetical protein